MFENLSGVHIAIIVVVVLIILWVIYYLMKCRRVIRHHNRPRPLYETHKNLKSEGTCGANKSNNASKPVPEETPFTLYNFYSPRCGWSQKFMPNWNKVAEALKSKAHITAKAIDATQDEKNKNLAFYYQIKGYPTILLVTPDKKIQYSGDRSTPDLLKFVEEHTSQY